MPPLARAIDQVTAAVYTDRSARVRRQAPRLSSLIENKYHKCQNRYHYVDNRNYVTHRETVTTTQIKKAGEEAQVPFRVAQQIRELLDAARKEYGAEQWDERDIDSEVQTLVFEEA